MMITYTMSLSHRPAGEDLTSLFAYSNRTHLRLNRMREGGEQQDVASSVHQ